MRFNDASLASFFKNGNPALKAVLFYGADEGYVGECREKATATVVPDSKDPFRLVDLKADAVIADVASLYAEADAISLMGGRRVIRIRDADKRLAPVMKEFLASYTGDALVIVTAESLKKEDALVKAFDTSDKGAFFACYADDAQKLQRLVFQTLAENRLTAADGVVAFIAANLGADRLVSRSELAKLVAYMGNDTEVTMEDAAACIGDASLLSVDNFIYEVAGGTRDVAQKTLERLYAEGQAPIGLLRAVSSHFKKLHVTLGRLSAGDSVDTAMRRLYPPLFYKRADEFKRQLRLWTPQKTAKALRLLTETERNCKFGAIPQELLCARAFLQIASFVSR